MYRINIVVIVEDENGCLDVKNTESVLVPEASASIPEQIKRDVNLAIVTATLDRSNKIIAFSHAIYPPLPPA